MITEDSLATSFAELYCGGPNRIRYHAPRRLWFVWDAEQKCWLPDETRKVFWLARCFCRRVADSTVNQNEARRIASAKMRTAIVDLAKDDPMLAAGDTFDFAE
jgi:hypothetical protein